MNAAESAQKTQQALIADYKVCEKTGMTASDWQARIELLIMYSVPPDKVTHRQDENGEWWHEIKDK